MNGMNYLNGHYWCKRASTRSAILANRFRLWFTNRKNVYDAVQICCCAFTHFFHHIVLFFRGNFFFYLTHFLCGFRQCISFIILFIDRFPIDATLSSSIDLSFFFFCVQFLIQTTCLVVFHSSFYRYEWKVEFHFFFFPEDKNRQPKSASIIVPFMQSNCGFLVKQWMDITSIRCSDRSVDR